MSKFNAFGFRPKPKPRPTVALGYPHGPISAPFMRSMVALREYEVAKMAGGLQPLVRHVIPQAGLYIDHNRNIIVEKFMETDAEWLLQVDTDIEFPCTLVETLLAVSGSEKRILAASVPLIVAGERPEDQGRPVGSAWMRTEQPGIWMGVPPSTITTQGIECDGIATAICLIHREVFEAIAEREGQRWFLKFEVGRLNTEKSRAAWGEGGAMKDRRFIPIGEDLAFSIRAAEAGFKLWCCKVPGLKHYKTLPLSHDYEEAPALPVAAGGAGT